MMSAPSKTLLPDKTVLKTFVDVMFRHVDPESFVIFKAFDEDDGVVFGAEGIKVSHPMLVDFACNRARQTAEWPKSAVFCPPAATFRNTFGEKGKWSATEDDVENGPSLSVDADQAPVRARERLELLLGEPTLVTASGGLWANPETGGSEERVHLHWVLRTATRTKADHELLKEARWLCSMLVGGDETLAPISHPLRWPGTIHNKNRSEPRLARIVSQSEHEIDLSEALVALRTEWDGDPYNGIPTRNGLPLDIAQTASEVDVASALNVIRNPDLPYLAWKRILLATWTATSGSEQGFLLVDAWSKQSAAKYDSRRTAKAWTGIAKSPPPKARLGAGSLFFLANQADPSWTKPSGRGPDLARYYQPLPETTDCVPRVQEPGSAWPEPTPLPSGLLAVDPLELDMLPDCIGGWVADISDRMQCPPDFVAASAMVALAAVLGRKIAVRPQERTDWTEVPNLWGCIVGRPGAMKSPAMSEALKPLTRLEGIAREANVLAGRQHDRELEAFKIRHDAAVKRARVAAAKNEDLGAILDIDPPAKPAATRLICNDATYEALGEILAANPNGVLAFRDELVSLLKTLDREENAAARGFFLTAWNGTTGYTFDRILRGITHIDAACVSLLGSTQPGRLADYIGRAVTGGAADDGLMQRFSILVWPDDVGNWTEVDRYPDSAMRTIAWDAFTRLHQITADQVGAQQSEYDKIPYLRLDAGGKDLFSSWRGDLERRLRTGGLHAALESHLSKYRKLVPSLALLGHLADAGIGPITQAAMSRAIRFASYLETHAQRAYGSGLQVESATAKALLNRLQKGDLKPEFTVRDVLQREFSNLSDKAQVTAGLELLDDSGWVRSKKVETGGRPKIVFTLNPRALG